MRNKQPVGIGVGWLLLLSSTVPITSGSTSTPSASLHPKQLLFPSSSIFPSPSHHNFMVMVKNQRGYPTSSMLSLKPPPYKRCVWDAIDHCSGAADGQESCNKHAAKGLGGEGIPHVHVFRAPALSPQIPKSN